MDNHSDKNGLIKPICKEYMNRNFFTKFCLSLMLILIGGMTFAFNLISGVELSEYFSEYYLLIPFLLGILCLFTGFIFILIVIHHRLNPQKSKLGKAILRQIGNFEFNSDYIDLNKMFTEIDDDIARHGKQYGKLYIGEKWLIGRYGLVNATAVKKENIRGIFKFVFKKTVNNVQQAEYQLCINDKSNDNTVFNIGNDKELTAAYDYLCGALPYARKGNFDSYVDFMALSAKEQKEFLIIYDNSINETKESEVKKMRQNFILSGSSIIPTSNITSESIKSALKSLIPGQSIRLSPILSLKSGSAAVLANLKEDSDGFYNVINILNEGETHVAYKAECSKYEAENILIKYFNEENFPILTKWDYLGTVTFVNSDRTNQGKLQINIRQYK